MKKVVVSLTLVGLLSLALGLAASAASADPVIPPSVTAVEPVSGFNDIDTHVTITGADFAVETSGGVTTTPTAYLQQGSKLVPLTGVTWEDSATLEATAPWGMDAGTYDLTVTNPDHETATLPGAFEVKPGLGNWNAGELNGAGVSQLLMDPFNHDRLYALAGEVGLFRSDDAGANWHFTSANVIGNADFVLDPRNPDWLYRTSSFDGLRVSKDKGDTWPTVLFDTSNDTSPRASQVFVSPNTTGTLFFATYGDSTPIGYLGLQWSTNGGMTWHVVPSMVGTAVQNVAFDPAPGSHDMVLATSDARVFRSSDGGATWSLAASSPPVTSMGFRGYLMYHPDYTDHPGEVWLVSTEYTSGGIFRSNDDITHWTDVSPSPGNGCKPTFVGPNDVYVWESHSTNDGSTWEPFGPWPTWGTGDFVFNPDDTHTIYFTNYTDGVLKSTTGGVTGPSGEASWTVSNQGLTGMRCSAMAVSNLDPLRVYASFDGWGGVYVSDDGTNSWKYHAIDGSGQLSQVLQDPFDPALVYAVGAGLYKSTNGGTTWPGTGWGLLLPAGSPMGGMGSLAADPDQPGHLLVACRVTRSSVHDHDLGYLYSSMDGGATWTSVVVTGTAGSIGPIADIEFDPSPDATGTVYLASDGNGVFKSTDHGTTWEQVGTRDMLGAMNLAIATHPQHVVAVLTGGDGLFVSPADHILWQNVGTTFENINPPVHGYSFVDHDSARMYAATYAGLYFSGDLGNTWARSAGALGGVQVTTLADTVVDGHTLLYAATTGGDAAAVWHPTPAAASAKASAKVGTSQMSAAAAPASSLVGAGIYRRAQVAEPPRMSRSSGSQDGWVLESSHTSIRGGKTGATATTLRLGDDAGKKQYRGVLSFNTSGIPDSAVITGVTLKVRKQGVTGGGDPVAKFNGFMADVKKGYFGTSSALQTGDFQAAASKSYAPFKPSLVGGWYSIDLTGAKSNVNKLSSHSGLTQVRLRFKLDDNNNRTANYLSLYSGNAPTSSRPQLIVTYYLP